MRLSFIQNGYFSLKNRQHLFLVVQNASRCIGTKGEDHSKNSGRNQKMTSTPTRVLQDPPWCSRKCIELAKITSCAAYCRSLNPVKRSNWPVFVSNLWIEVIVTCNLQHFCSNIFIAEKFGERPLSRHGERPTSSRSLDSPLQTAAQSPQERSLYDGGSNLQRRSSEELISSHGAFFVPRPPSRQKTGGRPKSAKGRVRPNSHVGRERKVSRESLSDVGDPVSCSPPLTPQLSFSKYKPLPSIGTGLVSKTNNCHSLSESQTRTRTQTDSNDTNYVSTLSKATASLSLHYFLPDEPTDAEPERLNLAIKLLDGTRHERWFRPTDSLGAVMAFAASVTKDELPPCLICTNEVPRRVFDNFSLSLSQARINSRTVVYLEDLVPLDNNSK